MKQHMPTQLAPNERGLSNLNLGVQPVISRPNADDIQAYNEYVVWFRDHTNFWFATNGLPFKVDTRAVEHKLAHPYLLNSDLSLKSTVSYFARAKKKGMAPQGRIYRSQLATAAAVIASDLVDGKRHVAILGAPQTGKSGSMYLCFCLEPICEFLLTGKVVIPILSLVNKNDLYEQLKDDFEAFARLHDGMAVVYEPADGSAPSSIYIAEYFQEKIGEQFFDDPAFEWHSGLIKNSVGNLETFRERVKLASEKGYRVKCYLDESHYGSAKESVFHRMAKEHIDAVDSDSAIVDIRAVSATNWEHNALDSFAKVPQRIEKGYRGVPYFNGWELPCIDADYTPTPPGLHKYTELGVKELSVSAYETLEKYLKWRARIEEWPKWKIERELKRLDESPYRSRFKDYRRDYCQAIRKMLETLLAKAKGTTGVCIRVARTNVMAQDVMKKVKAGFDKSVEFIDYFGGTTRESVAGLVQQKVPEGSKYVMMITGGARMGVAFPASTMYFVDLTNNPVTSTSEIQGSWGRGNGYWKDTHVYVSSRCYDSIKFYIDNKGRTLKRPHNNVVHSTRPGAPVRYVNIGKDMIEELEAGDLKNALHEIFKGIVDVIYLQSRRKQPNGRPWAWLMAQSNNEYDNSADIWPYLNLLVPLVEKEPRIARHGDLGFFEEVKLIHYEPDEDKRVKHKIAAMRGHPNVFTDDKLKQYDGTVGRRKKHFQIGDERGAGDRGRSVGGRRYANMRASSYATMQTKRAYEMAVGAGSGDRTALQAQLFIDIYWSKLDKEGKPAKGATVEKIDLNHVQLALRQAQQKYVDTDITERSCWHRGHTPEMAEAAA
jgi:hypothetical protein